MNCKCTCGKILKPGYIRCSKCELTAEQSASEVAEDSSVTAAERRTPETDAVWDDKRRNILVHSRNMERQRDEVREERDAALAKLKEWERGELRLMCKHEHEALDFAAQTQRAIKERNAALAKLDVLERSIADMSHPNMLMLVSDLETERTARKALEEALWRANRECCQIGHPHSDQHDHDAPCPVEARIVAALTLASKLP